MRTLVLEDFRNYERAEVAFAPGLNLVLGRNGHGKTNLLEAALFISSLSSYRPGSPGALVRQGRDRAILHAEVRARGRQGRVDVEIAREGTVRALVNKSAAGSRETGALLACVLFSPEDLDLVKGGPEFRRRFLDEVASGRRAVAAAQRQEFERVLRQRNGLLRASLANPRALKGLDAWDEQLVRTGALVVADRLAALEALSEVVIRKYLEVAGGGGDPTLHYRASWAGEPVTGVLEEQLREALEEHRSRELERGVTLVGPQRDDLVIELGGAEARTYASQGDQRSLAVALRLAQKEAVAEARDESPVLLLDDVFSELDDIRREQLSQVVSEGGQTVATATDRAGIDVRAARTIQIDRGKVASGE